MIYEQGSVALAIYIYFFFLFFTSNIFYGGSVNLICKAHNLSGTQFVKYLFDRLM